MNNIKISRVPVKELRTSEFPEFVTEVCAIVLKHEPTVLKIDGVFGLLQAVVPELMKFTVREGSHPLTAELHTQRHEFDKTLTGLLYLIRGIKDRPMQVYAAAAGKAIPVLDKYLGDINQQNNLVKRRNLRLLTDLIDADSELAAAIQTLGLKLSLDELKRLNNSISTLQTTRREVKSQTEKVDKTAVISAACTAMSKLFRTIEINQMVEKETDYAPLVRELNELMQEYNKLLSTRSQLPKGDDTKKTDTEVFADTVSV